MKTEDLKKLEEILESSLSAHQMADWGTPAVRKLICRVIINKFKKYLEKNDVN